MELDIKELRYSHQIALADIEWDGIIQSQDKKAKQELKDRFMEVLEVLAPEVAETYLALVYAFDHTDPDQGMIAQMCHGLELTRIHDDTLVQSIGLDVDILNYDIGYQYEVIIHEIAHLLADIIQLADGVEWVEDDHRALWHWNFSQLIQKFNSEKGMSLSDEYEYRAGGVWDAT